MLQVNLVSVIEQMREDRGGMVQTDEQYEYVYRAVVRYARLRETLGSLNSYTSDNDALRAALIKANRFVLS